MSCKNEGLRSTNKLCWQHADETINDAGEMEMLFFSYLNFRSILNSARLFLAASFVSMMNIVAMERKLLGNFHVENEKKRKFPPEFMAHKRCFRSHVPTFIMAAKNDLSFSLGHFFNGSQSHYFGMDDERPAVVNLIRNLF